MADSKTKDEGLLAKAAKAIGKAAGTVALVGKHESEGKQAAASPSPASDGKLPKKNKSRLPRRLKKANKKTAAKALKP